jgi:hypothetical protein
MDNRLDFFNSLSKYSDTLTDDDAVLVLSHNKKDGDCVSVLLGDWEILSMLLSIDGYVNFKDGNKDQFDNIKKCILNSAFNICMGDKKIKDKFIKGLSNPPKPRSYK